MVVCLFFFFLQAPKVKVKKKQGVSNRAKSTVKVSVEEEKAADLLNLRQVTLYALYAPAVGQAVLQLVLVRGSAVERGL